MVREPLSQTRPPEARRAALAAALLMVLAFGLAAALPASAQEGEGQPPPPAGGGDDPLKSRVVMKVPDQGGEYDVEELCRDIAMRHDMVPAIDDALKNKKVKFYTSAELDFYMLSAVLRTNGVELIITDVDGHKLLQALLIRNVQGNQTTPESMQDEEEVRKASRQEIVTAVYYFKHVDQQAIQQAQTAIRALMTRDPRRAGNVIQVPGTEAIILTDFGGAVRFYLDIVRAIDRPSASLDYRIVEVKYALADDIASLVNNLAVALDLESGGEAGKPPQPAARRTVRAPGRAGAAQVAPGEAQCVADPRTNSVIILALQEDLDKIERLIKKLDVEVKPPPRHFHVYKCVNANALDLADTLNALFGGVSQTFSNRDQTSGRLGGSSSSRRSGGVTTRSAGTRTTQPRTTQPRTLTPGAPGTQGTANPGALEIEIRIVPDEQTNSLLIQAGPEDYADIIQVLHELDKKRRRVIIEVQLWEIEVTDDLFFALDAAITDDATTNRNPNPVRGHGGSFSGLLSPVVSDDGSTLGLGPNLDTLGRGGAVALLTHGSFDRVPLIIQALATESDADLITRPFALTNDGTPALFEVVQQEPFQVTNSNTVSQFQGFDFAEARSSLEITPRIASGTNLTLDLILDINSFTAPPQGNAPPPSSGRSYQGTVTIPNRQYVVFGGLELESITESFQGIPFLGDIPYIGWLFGRTTKRKVKRRIYGFVRPVILDDETFEGDLKASKFAYDSMVVQSQLGKGLIPIVPDEVMDASAPGFRPAVMEAFGEGGSAAFLESDQTMEQRRAAAKIR